MKPARARSLQMKIRDNVRQGRLIPGIVIDVFFDKVTVKMSGNGSILHGLPIIGGPVVAGQSVNIDFTTNQPTVVAQGNEGVSADDLDKAIKSLQNEGVSNQLQLNILLYSGGGLSGTYSPSSDGFIAALGAANPGDVVWLPDVDIEVDFTVGEDISLVGLSNRQSIIRGTCTLSQGCSLENIAIINALSSAMEVNAVIAQGSGNPSWIKNCEIHAYNCGEGIANAISIQSTTTLLQITNSVIVGDCKEASESHAFTGLGGTCKIADSRLYSKSTDHYDGTTFYEHSNIGHVSEIDRMCAVITSEIYQMYRSYPQGDSFRTMNGEAWATPDVLTAETRTVTLSSNRYVVAQYENFIYFNVTIGTGDRILREFNTDTGNYKDVTVWSYATSSTGIFHRVVAVTKREVYVAQFGTTDIRVYKVNFETEDSTLIYEITKIVDEGDPETGYGYTSIQDLWFVGTKTSDGDMHVILYGIQKTLTGEDEVLGDLYDLQPYYIIKNYTQNGSWIKYDGDVILDSLTQSSNPTITIGYTTIFDHQWIVSGLSFTTGVSGRASMGVCAFDIVNHTTQQNIIFQDPSYSPFDPSLASIGKDSNGVYVHYSGDYQVSGEADYVVYKYIPETNDFTEHFRDPSSGYWILLNNNTKCYLVILSTGMTTIDMSDLSEILSDESYPAASRGLYLYDNNLMIFYLGSSGDMTWYDITDGGNTTRNLGISSDTSGATLDIYPLKDAIVMASDKYISGSTYNSHWYIIKEGA